MKQFEIDLFGLIRLMKADIKHLFIYCFIGGVIGTAIAFGKPKIYTSSVMLAPESSSGGNSLSSNISSLASMIGMDMNFGNVSDAIYPEIYPDLMKSTNFIVELFPINVQSKDKKINTSYYDYITKKQKSPFWTIPFSLFKKNSKDISLRKIDPFMLTQKQFDAVTAVLENVKCEVDQKTSVISISVTAQDPLIAATMVDSVKERLQVYITRYRTNKARKDVAYMEKLLAEARLQYTKARQLYGSYSDANQDLLLESYKSKIVDLENDMQLKYNIYAQILQQLQITKAKVQESTPAFTVVQSASVPIKHSNKPKIYTLVTFVFLAFVVRLSILTYKNRRKLIHVRLLNG